MKKFSNFISLVFFVALLWRVMKRIGIKGPSMPFDWLITSDFNSLLTLIKYKFHGFLDIDNLYQYEYSPSQYRDIKYKISFFHDFNKYESLSEQFDSVQNKYIRRIENFYIKIKNPTFFIRYISDEKKCRL